MALHEQCLGATDEWYTPPYVFHALGCSFDIDVASPGKEVTPWIPAVEFRTAKSAPAIWTGFVWMNPPFGGRNGLMPWLEKFFNHGDGIALTPDRTSAPWWQLFAPSADLILFVAPKIKFIGADGQPGKSPAQGTCLMAAGKRAMGPLYRAAEKGLGVLMTPGVACRDAADEIERLQGMKWQSIVTAPKDGTRVLLRYPKLPMAKKKWGNIRIGFFKEGMWHLDMAGNWRIDCTHWSPLPDDRQC